MPSKKQACGVDAAAVSRGPYTGVLWHKEDKSAPGERHTSAARKLVICRDAAMEGVTAVGRHVSSTLFLAKFLSLEGRRK